MSILTAFRLLVAKLQHLKMMTIANECFNYMQTVSCVWEREAMSKQWKCWNSTGPVQHYLHISCIKRTFCMSCINMTSTCLEGGGSAKFGVVVCKASMLNWLGGICHVWCNGMQGIYAWLRGEICHVWCNSMQGIYAQLMGGRSASRSAMCGVTVCKASMLNWGEICQADLPNMRSACRSAKFGIMVCKACMLNWWGVDLPSMV